MPSGPAKSPPPSRGTWPGPSSGGPRLRPRAARARCARGAGWRQRERSRCGAGVYPPRRVGTTPRPVEGTLVRRQTVARPMRRDFYFPLDSPPRCGHIEGRRADRHFAPACRQACDWPQRLGDAGSSNTGVPSGSRVYTQRDKAAERPPVESGSGFLPLGRCRDFLRTPRPSDGSRNRQGPAGGAQPGRPGCTPKGFPTPVRTGRYFGAGAAGRNSRTHAPGAAGTGAGAA